MADVTVKSRIPKILADLPTRVDIAAKQTAEMIEQRAKSRVPVGDSPPHIRDDIHVERMGRAEYAVVAGRTDTFYGHILEFGGVNHSPQPFLVPALEESRDEGIALGRAALRRL